MESQKVVRHREILSPRARIWFLYRLFRNNEEELEMAELVHALIGMTMVADFEGSALRQPNSKLGFVELDWSISDVEVLQL
jgi:hypothetical protein